MNEHEQVLRRGETLAGGRFKSGDLVGYGKYAQVCEAVDLHMQASGKDARVAIKILHPAYAADEEAKQRLKREGRLQKYEVLGRHPNVVAVVDTGLHPYTLPDEGSTVQLPFLVLEYVEHITLCEYLEQYQGGVPVDETLFTIIRQLASALDWMHAHEQGIVHRDLADHNILLRCRREGHDCVLLAQQDTFVQLTDFGLAFSKGEGTITHNRLDHIAANIRYAAPEILYGERPTAQDDLYSFGVLMYRLLFHEFPFPLGDILDQEELWDYADLVRARPVMFSNPEAVPLGVQDCLIKALAKTRVERYTSAHEMADELIAALQEWKPTPAGAREGSLSETPKPESRAAGAKLAPVSSGKPGAFEAAKTVQPAKKRRSKLAGCLTRSLALLTLLVLAIVALVVGAANKWLPGRDKTPASPTVQLLPVDSPGATVAPTLVAVANPTETPEASQPAPGFGQADELAFAYVSYTGGAADVTGQPGGGDGAEQLLFRGEGELQHLTWSPDGELLAYTSDAEGVPGLYVTDGISARRLSPEGVSERWPTWRPDSSALAVTTETGERAYLSLVNVASGQHAPLTGPNFNAWAPAWSPDGEILAFVSDMGEGLDVYALSLTDMDRAPVNISRSGDAVADAPAWAPDGSWLVYATAEGLRWASLENLEPGAPHVFTQNGQDRAPCFLNEREILFQRTSGAGTVSLYQGRLGNAAQERVADNAAWAACRP